MPKLDEVCNECGFAVSNKISEFNINPVGASNGDVVYLVLGAISYNRGIDSSYYLFEKLQSLRRYLSELLPNYKLRCSYAFRCPVSNNSKLPANSLRLCGGKVLKDIQAVKPKFVFCFGSIATNSVLGNLVSYKIGYNSLLYSIINSGLGYGIGIAPDIEDLDNHATVSFQATFNKLRGCDLGSYPIIKQKFNHQVFLKLGELENFLTKDLQHLSLGICAFDLETSGLDPYISSAAVNTIAFAWEGKNIAIPCSKTFWGDLYDKFVEYLYLIFIKQYENGGFVCHNGNFDWVWLVNCVFENKYDFDKIGWDDTIFMAHLLDERTGSGIRGLKFLLFKYLGVCNWGMAVSNLGDVFNTDFSLVSGITKQQLDLLKYNSLDCFYTLELYKFLKPRLKDYERIYECMRDCAKIFVVNRLKGFSIDIKKLEILGIDINKRIIDVEDKLLSICLDKSKIRSDAFWVRYFNTKGYKFLRVLKTRFSLDADCLRYFIDFYSDKIAVLLLEFRNLSKLKTTYIEGLKKLVNKDVDGNDVVRAIFKLTGTVTGRLSCSYPNMQNIPKGDSCLRDVFTAKKGSVWLSVDYGQLEARILCMLCKKGFYQKAILEGYDIHTEFTKYLLTEILGLSFTKENKKEWRPKVKRGVFGVMFGAGPLTISKTLGISEIDAKLFIARLFVVLPEIKAYFRGKGGVIDTIERQGYLTSLFGRKRRIPISYPQAVNFNPQSSGSDCGLYSLRYLATKYNVLSAVHDEINFEIPLGSIDKAMQEIGEVMTTLPFIYMNKNILKSFIPLEVNCSIGKNWGQLKSSLSFNTIGVGCNNQMEAIRFCKQRNYF